MDIHIQLVWWHLPSTLFFGAALSMLFQSNRLGRLVWEPTITLWAMAIGVVVGHYL